MFFLSVRKWSRIDDWVAEVVRLQAPNSHEFGYHPDFNAGLLSQWNSEKKAAIHRRSPKGHDMNQPQHEEERDDAIVGQAFVWSASVLLLLGAAAGVAYWRMSIKPPAVVKKTELVKPEIRERP